MAEVGSWYVTVMPNMKQFNSAIASAAKTSGSKFGGIFNTALGVALGGVATQGIGAFVSSLDAGISRLDTLETFPRVMENIGVATEDVARSAVKDLATRLEGLPTRLDDATAAVQQFALQNGDIDRSVDMFTALNNALLAGGKSADLQAAAAEQISQAYSKGKPDMMEWRSMLQTMGPALKMVARSWGMSVDEMGEALRNGEIPMDDFMSKLIELNETGIDEFASLSEQAGVSTENLGTAVGLIGTRFSNAWAQILDAIGRENLVEIIDGATSGFLGAVETYLVPAIQSAKDWLDDFAEASQPIQDAWNGLVGALQEQFAPAFDAVSQAISDNLPTIEELVGAISGLLTFITDNIKTIETFALAFLLFQGITALLPILTAVGGVLATIGSAIAVVMTGLVPLSGVVAVFGVALNPVPIIIGAIALALAFLITHFEEVSAAFEVFKEWVVTGFEAVKTKAGEIVQGIADFFSNGIAGWQALWDAFVTGIQAIPGKIVGFFSNIGTRIGAKFQEIKTKAETVFNGIVTFVQGIPDKILGFFSGIGSRITSAIGNIKFPSPHVTWSEGLFGIKLPHVEWYAQGGFVNGAQIIGAGEKGPELIWPSYGSALDRYGAAIAAHMGGTGTTYNVYINDARINDDAAIRADVLQLLSDMQRFGSMNRG